MKMLMLMLQLIQRRGMWSFVVNMATVNVRGLGGSTKKRVVRTMVRMEKLDFLCIHETKLESIDHHLCSTLWDGPDFDWVSNLPLENPVVFFVFGRRMKGCRLPLAKQSSWVKDLCLFGSKKPIGPHWFRDGLVRRIGNGSSTRF
ncbi:hypothetical protein Lal_00032393 [Lupinus albus]|nr:hypothetical protein Lal_00032393 [Lupinus albus]